MRLVEIPNRLAKLFASLCFQSIQRIIMHSNKRLTLEDFVSKARKVHGNRYDYSKVKYVNSSTKVKIICPDHGVFLQSYEDHVYSKAGCPECNGGVKKTLKSFLEKARSIHGDKYDYSKFVYVNTRTPGTIICPKHGDFSQRPNNHTHKTHPQGCPACGNELIAAKKEKSLDDFLKMAERKHGQKYDYSKVEYSGCTTQVEVVCPIHGSFFPTPNNHTKPRASGCPICANGRRSSTQETRLVEALNSLGVETQTTVRGLIPTAPNLEVDIWLPNYKIAVEIDGVYWHSKKERSYHYEKTVQLRRNGITLLHFWDSEVEEKFDLVLSMVKQRLGLARKLYARKLVVCKLDNKEASEFLSVNHLQGSVRFSVAYGLKTKAGKLAQVMALGRPYMTKGYDWEIKRLASHQSLTVVGGASRLLAAFRKENTGSILTYADLRYSSGAVYRKLGFEFSHRSLPNYWWARGFKLLLSRHQTQKAKLGKLLGSKFNQDASETENMQRSGFLKVHDCGNLVFTLV